MNALPEIKNPLASARVVVENMSQEEYRHQLVERGHPDYVMSRGELRNFRRNPHKWLCGYSEKDTDATDWGSDFEELVMYPERQENVFVLPPDNYTNSKGVSEEWTWRSSTCRKWRTEQEKAGKRVIDPDTWTQLHNALKFFWANAEIREFVKLCKKQVMVEARYEDKETGLAIPLKCLIDLVPPADHPVFSHELADLKTGTNGEPFTWRRDIFKYWLHVQAALYLDAWNKATGEERTGFRHPMSESGPPWECTPYALTADYITLGRMTYIEALKDYAKCLKTGHWPGYLSDPNVQVIDGWGYIGPEPWMVNR